MELMLKTRNYKLFRIMYICFNADYLENTCKTNPINNIIVKKHINYLYCGNYKNKLGLFNTIIII